MGTEGEGKEDTDQVRVWLPDKVEWCTLVGLCVGDAVQGQ